MNERKKFWLTMGLMVACAVVMIILIIGTGSLSLPFYVKGCIMCITMFVLGWGTGEISAEIQRNPERMVINTVMTDDE